MALSQEPCSTRCMPSLATVRQQVAQHFQVVAERCHGDEVTFICPEPGCGDNSGNRSVNAKTLTTNCWRCNKGGYFPAWAANLGYPVELEAAAAPTMGELATLVDGLGELAARPAPGFTSGVNLPRGFTRLDDGRHRVYWTWVEAMARRKHLDVEDLAAAGVGFTSQDARWEPYAIFPVTEWGKTVYYQGRTYHDVPGESTKRFPNRQECPQSSRYWVYGIDELRAATKTVAIVVESILNVLSLRKELARRRITSATPVAVFKHSISGEQLTKLAACRGVAEVCMLYDEDALPAIYKECRRLANKVPVTYVKMPPGVDANDDVRLAVDLFLKRRRYSDLDAVLDRLPT
jgi:hypothetical protein